MTDPVRPVAPRLLTYDVPGVLRVAAINGHNELRQKTLSVGAWTPDCREHYACRVYLDYCEHLKAAAAPVPCAASPAPEDLAVAMLAACEATIRHLWDIAGRFDTAQCNKIRDEIHRLNALTLPAIVDVHDRAKLCATGEGARDLRENISHEDMGQRDRSGEGEAVDRRSRDAAGRGDGRIIASLNIAAYGTTNDDARRNVLHLAQDYATEASVPLSAIRALVQQWRERENLNPDDFWAGYNSALQDCAVELAAMCPAPPEDKINGR